MLSVNHVSKTFASGFFGTHRACALDDVSLQVGSGEIFGLVGGSGSGKTMLSRIIAGLLQADSGSVVFEGIDLTRLGKSQWKDVRASLQMVFQNPQKTFNPRFTVRQCCAEPLRLYGLAATPAEEERMIASMLERVEVSLDQLDKYPHEISGGQAQRVAIARALALKPKLLICDEPTSMLDISVQAQVVSLLRSINAEEGTSLLFITHDIDVVRHLCHRVAVLNAGRVEEQGSVEEVLSAPKIPFVKELVSSAL